MRGGTRRLVLLAAAVLLISAAWRGTAREQGDGKVDVRGTITKAMPTSEEARKQGLLRTILVEGPLDRNTNYDKAMIRITAKTKIEKLVGKERQPARADDLVNGVRIEARFVGPVAESYPVQATAGEILILPNAK
jgi:hypothetical protein